MHESQGHFRPNRRLNPKPKFGGNISIEKRVHYMNPESRRGCLGANRPDDSDDNEKHVVSE